MPADHGAEGVDHLVVALPGCEDAGLGDACLAVVHERRHLEAVHGGGQVGVVEDDGGRLAAELERHPLELLAADAGDAPAGSRRAGERDLVDVAVADQVLADLAARRARC